MEISREKKKEEAIQRMKELGIINGAIKQFKDDDIVMVSEPPIGGLYWLDDEQKKIVDDFEKENDALVFMVVKAFTNFGNMLSLLFISDYEEEWEMDRDDIKDNIVMSYTINETAPELSEFGSIGVKRVGGGLIRKF